MSQSIAKLVQAIQLQPELMLQILSQVAPIQPHNRRLRNSEVKSWLNLYFVSSDVVISHTVKFFAKENILRVFSSDKR